MRCYKDALGRSDGACDQQASYVAKLDWTEGLMLLCEEHAREEREWDSIVWIRNIPVDEVVDRV
jgi:hypothetical protein